VTLQQPYYDAGAPLLFAFDRGTIWLHSVAIAALKYDGLLWISYPKRSSKVETDLTRDRGWEVMTEAGLRPVTQVSIDALWSALRFRPLERVGR
jgi:hypothetical protein